MDAVDDGLPFKHLPEGRVASVEVRLHAVREEVLLQAPGVFERLVRAVRDQVARRGGAAGTFGRIDVSAFSAGYGAVRALLTHEQSRDRIDGVLLLDALHTGYRPEGRVVAEGGVLETRLLEPFVQFARRAAREERRFVLTHSEVFPGTFASTTETADYLVDTLGLERNPVLNWGPVGMQQVSEARRGGLYILGFAGNSAPDHMDHLHGMAGFLPLLRP